MRGKTKNDREQKYSPSKKYPFDPLDYPQARDFRSSAEHAELRTPNPRVAAPRQFNRSVERSNHDEADDQ